MAGIDQNDEQAWPGRLRLDWSDLQLFLAVAETGSFSGAARSLGLTQPTVSQRAKDIEARMGAQLFIRGPSGIGLTGAGLQMFEPVRAMNRSASAIGNLIANKDARDEGWVRVRAPDGLATFWLAPHLARLNDRFPKLQIALDAGLWPDDPVNTDIEVSVQYEENKDPDNVVIPLGVSHFMAFASQSHLDTYGTPRTLAELAQHRSIRHAGQKSRQHGTWSPEVSAFATLWGESMQTNSSTAVLYAVRAGAGVAVMPSSAILFAPELVPLEPAPLVSARKWLVYHRDVGQVGRARRVIDWIKEIYDPAANPWFRNEFVHPSEFPRFIEENKARFQGANVTPLRHHARATRA